MTDETTSLDAQMGEFEQRIAVLEQSGEKDALASALEDYAALLRENKVRLLDAANMTARAKTLRGASKSPTVEPDSKVCKSCAERIKVKALKCRFCGANQTGSQSWSGIDKGVIIGLARRYGIHACLIVVAIFGCKYLLDQSTAISLDADRQDENERNLTEQIIDRRRNPDKYHKPIKLFDLSGKTVSDVNHNLFHFINDHEVDMTARSGRIYTGNYSLDGAKLRIVVDSNVMYYKYLGMDVLQDDIEREYGLEH